MITTHLPHSISLFGGNDKLSGEWVEAQNDEVKKTHLQKTDHRSPNQTLQTQLRLEWQEAETKLEEHDAGGRKRRAPRPENAERMKEIQKKRRVEEEEERVAATTALQSPYANFTAKELRKIIFDKTGKKTRKQNLQCLLDILHQFDSNGDVSLG